MQPSGRFELADTIGKSSKTSANIAGFPVYLFGVDELNESQAKNTTVLFHIHGRTRTYADAEELAHYLLNEWRGRGSSEKGLIIATFDNRNHGTRSIDATSVQSWSQGNQRHGQDMLSTIDGIVVDIQTVMTFLESYFESRFTPKEFIVTGLSLGGHVAWDSLARIPLIKSAVIIVGCPNLTPMLLERLGGYRSADEVPSGTKEWPKSLEKLYVARDKSLESISGKRILILNGAIDELVPSKFTVPWVEKFGANNEVEFLEGANTGHWLSWEMTEKMVEWIVKTVI